MPPIHPRAIEDVLRLTSAIASHISENGMLDDPLPEAIQARANALKYELEDFDVKVEDVLRLIIRSIRLVHETVCDKTAESLSGGQKVSVASEAITTEPAAKTPLFVRPKPREATPQCSARRPKTSMDNLQSERMSSAGLKRLSEPPTVSRSHPLAARKSARYVRDDLIKKSTPKTKNAKQKQTAGSSSTSATRASAADATVLMSVTEPTYPEDPGPGDQNPAALPSTSGLPVQPGQTGAQPTTEAPTHPKQPRRSISEDIEARNRARHEERKRYNEMCDRKILVDALRSRYPDVPIKEEHSLENVLETIKELQPLGREAKLSAKNKNTCMANGGVKRESDDDVVIISSSTEESDAYVEGRALSWKSSRKLNGKRKRPSRKVLQPIVDSSDSS